MSKMSAVSRFFSLSRTAKLLNKGTGVQARDAGVSVPTAPIDRGTERMGQAPTSVAAAAVSAAVDVAGASSPRFAAARPTSRSGSSPAAPSASTARASAPRGGSIKPRTVDVAAQARARTGAVFASAHSVGRERQAADMLATSMGAAEIIGLLAKAPRQDAQNAMLAALIAHKNPELAPGNSDLPSRESAEEFWGRVRASGRR